MPLSKLRKLKVYELKEPCLNACMRLLCLFLLIVSSCNNSEEKKPQEIDLEKEKEYKPSDFREDPEKLP